MSSRPICHLPGPLAATLRAQATQAYPEECCGLLIGQRDDAVWSVDRLVPSRNAAPPPRFARFEVDPALLVRVHREARAAGEILIGHYHSHPNGSPAPSAQDRRQAVQPDQLWLIVSAGKDGACEIGAWLRGAGDDPAFEYIEVAEPLASAVARGAT